MNAAVAPGGAAAYVDEYFDRPRPAGYATLFAPGQQREMLRAVCALHGIIRQIGRSREPDAARIKLQWWQDELARLERAVPRHPLSVLLCAAGAPSAPLAGALRQAVVASASDLAGTPLDENAAIEAHCLAADGSRLRAAAALFGPAAPSLGQGNRHLGHGIGLARLQLAAETTLEAEFETLASAQTLIERGLSALQRAPRPAAVFPFVLGRLWLQKIAATPRVPHPVRQLFAAWRAARSLQ